MSLPKAWKSINQQNAVDIQTTRSAFIRKVSRVRTERADGLLPTSPHPTLTITTLTGFARPGPGVFALPQGAPVLGLGFSSPGPAGLREVEVLIPSLESGRCREHIEALGQPTLCSSAGPFRFTGPGWSVALCFQIVDQGAGPLLEVALEDVAGRRLHCAHLESEAIVVVRPSNPHAREPQTYIVVQLLPAVADTASPL